MTSGSRFIFTFKIRVQLKFIFKWAAFLSVWFVACPAPFTGSSVAVPHCWRYTIDHGWNSHNFVLKTIFRDVADSRQIMQRSTPVLSVRRDFISNLCFHPILTVLHNQCQYIPRCVPPHFDPVYADLFVWSCAGGTLFASYLSSALELLGTSLPIGNNSQE